MKRGGNKSRSQFWETNRRLELGHLQGAKMNKASEGSQALLKQIQSKGANTARIVKKDDHPSPRCQVQDDSFCGLFESFGVDTRVLMP
jgi:hypothetical protein